MKANSKQFLPSRVLQRVVEVIKNPQSPWVRAKRVRDLALTRYSGSGRGVNSSPASQPQYGVGAAGFAVDGQRVVAAGSQNTSIVEWDVVSGKQTRMFLERWWRGYSRVTMSADGKPRGWWDTEKNASVPGAFNVPDSSLVDSSLDKAAISADVKRAFTWSGSLVIPAQQKEHGLVAQSARLWDLEAGGVIWSSPDFPGARSQIAFSPDGTEFVTTSHEGGAKLRDATTGAVRRTLGTKEQSFEWVAFSPNGKTILTWGADKLMRLWDAQAGKLRQSFSVPVVTCVTFSPDGTKIATGGTGEWRGN